MKTVRNTLACHEPRPSSFQAVNHLGKLFLDTSEMHQVGLNLPASCPSVFVFVVSSQFPGPTCHHSPSKSLCPLASTHGTLLGCLSSFLPGLLHAHPVNAAGPLGLHCRLPWQASSVADSSAALPCIDSCLSHTHIRF